MLVTMTKTVPTIKTVMMSKIAMMAVITTAALIVIARSMRGTPPTPKNLHSVSGRLTLGLKRLISLTEIPLGWS